MCLGTLYRLADDRTAAQRHSGQARAMRALRGRNPLDVERLIPASVLVGRDDEAAELVTCLPAINPDTDLIA